MDDDSRGRDLAGGGPERERNAWVGARLAGMDDDFDSSDVAGREPERERSAHVGARRAEPGTRGGGDRSEGSLL